MNDEPAGLPRYLTPKELSAETGISVAALAKRRSRGLPPQFIKVSRRTVLYPTAPTFAWLETLPQTTDG